MEKVKVMGQRAVTGPEHGMMPAAEARGHWTAAPSGLRGSGCRVYPQLHSEVPGPHPFLFVVFCLVTILSLRWKAGLGSIPSGSRIKKKKKKAGRQVNPPGHPVPVSLSNLATPQVARERTLLSSPL